MKKQETYYHGTSTEVLPYIMAEGLKYGGRRGPIPNVLLFREEGKAMEWADLLFQGKGCVVAVDGKAIQGVLDSALAEEQPPEGGFYGIGEIPPKFLKALPQQVPTAVSDEDRELVVHYMRDSETDIKDEDFWAVYCIADGFGPGLPLEMLAEINNGFDWSHVRDSSPEAWKRMAEYLREHGYELPGNNGPKTGR